MVGNKCNFLNIFFATVKRELCCHPFHTLFQIIFFYIPDGVILKKKKKVTGTNTMNPNRGKNQ